MEDFDTMLEKQQEYIESGKKPDYSGEGVKDLPSNFTKWIDRNEERISGAKSLPYFLADNGKIKGGRYVPTNFGKTPRKGKGITTSMPLLTKKDVDVVLKNGGSISVHPSRLNKANLNKQERAKFTKEQRMCNVLAGIGYRIEMLEEVSGKSSPDIMINGIKSDLKSTKGDGNIVKYGKKAIYEQDADIVVFEFEKMNFEIHQEINKLRNMNIHGMYIVKGSNKIVKF